MGVDFKLTGVPNFDQLEIVKQGITNISSDGSTLNWSTTAHNLGYIPMVIAFLNDVGIGGIFNDGNIILPTYLNASIDTTNDQIIFRNWIHAAVDTTNLYIILFNSLGTAVPTYQVKYYLLRERSQ